MSRERDASRCAPAVVRAVLPAPLDAARAGTEAGLGATGADFDAALLATDPFAFPVGLWTAPEAREGGR